LKILKVVYDYRNGAFFDADEDDSEERILRKVYDACEKIQSYNGEGNKEALPRRVPTFIPQILMTLMNSVSSIFNKKTLMQSKRHK
jgi:hypothetical protein